MASGSSERAAPGSGSIAIPRGAERRRPRRRSVRVVRRPPATRQRLLARDRPILGHDVDPGLTRIEPDSLAGGIAERKDIENVGPRQCEELSIPDAGTRDAASSAVRHYGLPHE